MSHTSRWLPVLWFFVAVSGLSAVLIACLTILLSFGLASAALGQFAGVMGGLGFVGILLGMALLVTGIRGWGKKPSLPVRLHWGWLALLAVLFAAGSVGIVTLGNSQSPFLLALLHFAMIALPILIGLWIIIRIAGAPHAPAVRELVLTASGGVSSVVLAFPLEIIGFIAAAVLVVAIAAVFPSGQMEVSRLMRLLETWTQLPSPEVDQLVSLASSPVAIAVIGLVLVMIVPAIEELVKTLSMGVMGVWRRPGKGKAFIWGVTCGFGFALVEGIINGSVGLGGTVMWAGSIFSRLFASMMHGLTSGLLGLGWASIWERAWWRFPLFYVMAVFLHGFWNFSVILLVAGGLMSVNQGAAGYLVAITGGGMLLVTAILVIGLLIMIPLLLKDTTSKPAPAHLSE